MEDKVELSHLFKETQGQIKDDFANLRVLQWMDPKGQRFFRNFGYESVREVLKQLDYQDLQPTAYFLKEKFNQVKHNLPIPRLKVERVKQAALMAAEEYGKKAKAKQLTDNEFAFGQGLRTDDLVRIYLAPRLTEEIVKSSVERIMEHMYPLSGQIKVYVDDWYDPVKVNQGREQVFQEGRSLNRIVIYLARKSPYVTAFLKSLAQDKELLGWLEDSGEWFNKYRIPIALGVNLVEGAGSRSWDMDEGKFVVGLKSWLKDRTWPEYVFDPRDSRVKTRETQQFREVVAAKSLEPIGRITNMPALKND